MTGENLGCYFSPHVLVISGRYWVKGWMGAIIILASLKDFSKRAGKNMVQHPCNYELIFITVWARNIFRLGK